MYEGVSFLVLLFVAMPLKYWADMPMAVRIVGGLHGILFLWFVAVIYVCYDQTLLSFRKCVFTFGLSLVPFGTFFLKRVVVHV